jgi:hypothetical protein
MTDRFQAFLQSELVKRGRSWEWLSNQCHMNPSYFRERVLKRGRRPGNPPSEVLLQVTRVLEIDYGSLLVEAGYVTPAQIRKAALIMTASSR